MKKFLIALTLLLSVTTCAGAEPARNLSTSVNAFCWKFFAMSEKIWGQYKGSTFYSPYGLHAALSIMANGASGETRQEILNVLEADSVDALNDGHKNFAATTEKNYRGDSFFAETSLFLVSKKIAGRGLDENFKRVATDVYNSDVRKADFAGNADAERQQISRWVADKTNGFVKDYYPLANPGTLAELLNVVYFKGKWALPFKPANTAKAQFTNLDGQRVTVAMMNNVFKDAIAYRADDKFKGIALPYTSNAAMYLILPADDAALNVAERWNAESVDYREKFLDALKSSPAFDGEVVVRLPKLSLDFETALDEKLKEIGLERAFTNDAEFNIVKNTSLKIDEIRHTAKLKVDEEGTEAAAVTEITMVGATAMPNPRPPRRVYFIAERPFLFVIRDVESGVILFAGVMNKF